MIALKDIAAVENKIKLAAFREIRLLYKLIFENEAGRGSRRRLREFSGFQFLPDSKDYNEKLEYIMESFSIQDLSTICNILNLCYDGDENEISQRIVKNLLDLKILESNMDYLCVETEDDETQDGRRVVVSAMDRPNQSNERLNIDREIPDLTRLALSFRDVESTLKTFNGSEGSVDRWILDFEETAELMSWNELQKLIFAKKSLVGLARLFIQGESGINSFGKLKLLLKEEFGDTFNSARLHKMLTKRKMDDKETVQEYYLHMKELASRGCIENEALMEYIIDGIQDSGSNKVILYGAKDLKEFKEKLKIYQKIRQMIKAPKSRTELSPISKSSHLQKRHTEVRCYNCGQVGHKSSICTHKDKGLKCFKCNDFGHRAIDCGKNTKRDKQERQNYIAAVTESPLKAMHKIVTISNIQVNALIDTGSQVTLIRKDVYERLGSPKLHAHSMVLTGFGDSKVKPFGSFEQKIEIDSVEFLTNICVVDNTVMTLQAIIGSDILSRAEVTIQSGSITFTKSLQEVAIRNISVDKEELNIGSSVSKTLKHDVEGLISNYRPIKTKTTNIEMSIMVKDDQPIAHRPRRLPFVERNIVDKQVEEWVKNKIVEPCSSEYSSQVVVVKKKDGTPRVCIDYRKLNKVIVKDRYPLPLIEDILDRLQDAHIFSTLDLKNGFFHVHVAEGSRHYTSFVTHSGQYQFLRVPFGLCTSPSIFQRFINAIFRSLTIKGIVLPYMDDLVIPAGDEIEGIARLKLTLQVAQDYGLEINFKKCQFLDKKIEFLGHVIEGGKIYPSTLKTTAVSTYPEPRSLRDVQSFLGLTGYFRKYIPNYSIIAKPLSDLLKKDLKFKFQESERNAFNYLKQLLCEKPVLAIYSQKSETEIHTDASIDGYGAVLMQRAMNDNCFHPVYYISKKTTNSERKYSSYELEVLAIVGALKKFRVYVLGIHFKIITDCNSFKMTMSKRDISTRIARWALLLEDFDYEIEHRSGSKMSHVDALSRSPVTVITLDSTISKIRKAQEQDHEVQTIKEIIKVKPYEDYCLKNDILYKFVNGNEVLVVPESMQDELIRTAHDRGHFACKRTEEILKQDFYIPRVKLKIEKVIANCVACILVNRKCGKQEGQLHPLHKEGIPLHTYHLDHLGPLESTNKNYKYTFAIIDGFTKFVWLYPTKTTTSFEAISKLKIQGSVFGNPTQLITDRGTTFTSKEFADYCAAEKIQHHLITTGLPRSNGQVERLNSIIISVLSKLSLENPSKWYLHVSRVQQVINSTFQRSINTTPFELLFGTKMNMKSSLEIRKLLDAELQAHFINSRDDLRIEAKRQIQKVQEENRKTYNLRRCRPRKFALHDLIAIKRTQYGTNLKLKSKFLGPYKIIKIKSNDTYDVERVGFSDGPLRTSTCAEYIKPWSDNQFH